MVKFIEEERSAGKTDTQIAHDLLEAGWHMDIIHKSMHGAPIKKRGYEPILDIKKQPIRREFIIGGVGFVIVFWLLIIFA